MVLQVHNTSLSITESFEFTKFKTFIADYNSGITLIPVDAFLNKEIVVNDVSYIIHSLKRNTRFSVNPYIEPKEKFYILCTPK